MKHARKLASLLLALVMVFALATTAFAQEQTVPGTGGGSITITNAAKGETYTIYRLFDATVNADGSSIAYYGKIPDSLKTYFIADKNGYISATDAAKDGDHMSAELQKALKAWTATEEAAEKVAATAVSDGSALTFRSLVYGYYVVTTSQGNSVISVDSTMPNVDIVDKNSSTPSGLTKTATATATGTDKSFSIGDTVTYTVRFKTSNYDGAGENAKKIVSYTIKDTLPDFLEDVKVTSIIVDNDGDETTTKDQTTVTAQFDKDKKIVIDWYDEANNKFLYNNGATIIITYTAVVTEKAAIDGAGNTNNVTVTWTTEGNEPGSGKLENKETIFTYAIALKKVNDKGVALRDAEFQFPFYVKSTPDKDGAYIYAGTTEGEGLTNQIATPKNGVIVVKGVKAGSYVIEEVTAPDGYNQLTAPVTVTAVKTGETSTHTTVYLDKDGKFVDASAKEKTEVKVDIDTIAATALVVVNKAGTELPSTGGMGTTIFYVLGSVLVLGAVVLLVTKKRMSDANR